MLTFTKDNIRKWVRWVDTKYFHVRTVDHFKENSVDLRFDYREEPLEREDFAKTDSDFFERHRVPSTVKSVPKDYYIDWND